MMQKIQRFGGAMFTPVMLFAFAGVVVGLGTLFTTPAIMGPLAGEETVWYRVWNVVLSGGWTVFNQLPLLFAVALPVGLARKQQARCCMEALVAYLTFNYFVSQILVYWGADLGVDFAQEVGQASGLALIGGIKTLDMGMLGALLVAGVVVALHNRLFDTKLPEWLGVFSGSTFVYMVSFLAMLPLAVLAVLVWPHVQAGMRVLQGLIVGAGTAGVGVYVFLERALIPFGLHHLLYAPIYYDSVVVEGGIYAAWANALPQLAATTAPLREVAPWAALTATGWSKIFGVPGIAAAFYATARPQNRKRLLALLVPVTLTAVLCGVTEPIEFTFLFVAPQLYLVHAVLAALLSSVMNLFGVVGVFSGGLIEMSSFNFIPLASSHGGTYLVALAIGLCFTAVYFLVFRWLILRFDFMTPGRGPDDEVRLHDKGDYQRKRATVRPVGVSAGSLEIVRLLGGAANIVGVTSCVTRLRVDVRDPALVAPEKDFCALDPVRAVFRRGRAVQVIVGMNVTEICEQVNALLEDDDAAACEKGVQP